MTLGSDRADQLWDKWWVGIISASYNAYLQYIVEVNLPPWLI